MAGTSERSGRWNLLGGRGTFGSRLLALLLLAAPFPLALLGLISLSQFEKQLRSETDERLTARARDAGFALYGRLVDIDRGLGIEGAPEAQLDENPVSPPWQRKLRALFETASPDRQPPHPGAPVLDQSQRVRLLEGSAVLSIGRDPLDRPSIWLLRPKPGSTTGVLWAELEVEWLWPASSVPPESGVHWALLDAGRWEILATSPAPASEFLHALDAIGVGASGGFAWDDALGVQHRARFWTVPLGFEFAYRGLSTVVSEADPVEPPVAALRRSLVLGGSAALLFAALVVARRLRSDLAPLTELSGAAERLEQGDLAARVRIAGPSDLARLGDSFNRMADGLERQFHLLGASQEVTLAALESEPDQISIARLFVARMHRILPGFEISVALLGGRGRTILVGCPAGAGSAIEATESAVQLPDQLLESSAWVMFDDGHGFPPIGLRRPISRWLPLRHGIEVLGAIGVASGAHAPALASGDLRVLNAPASQLALALSRVRFLDDLERANWGALTALARAVDAKSPWTQGHSERVSRIAVAIALERELPGAEVRLVRRGSLLHDVGKIGVPRAVLDKPDKLGAEEMAILQTHVEKGVRILEPMEGFTDVLPIVWQHHERLDGSGYPKALRGEAIDPLASLVAVADVFEALTAARPYRKAQEPDQTLAYLRRLAGIQFDELSVAALERLRDRSGLWPFYMDS